MGTQKTIIYRLVLTNPGFGPYLLFLALKRGAAPQVPIMSLGPQNPTKKLTHWEDLLGHLLSRNNVSNFSVLGTPPPPYIVFSLLFFFLQNFPNPISQEGFSDRECLFLRICSPDSVNIILMNGPLSINAAVLLRRSVTVPCLLK